ncbi:Nuclear envelope morphology protein 1 [Coemansia javaensis]|uniref:Nuclear envelope morphology protein 1 n=1 Tax=Coemansia javaensis TaxID=2761396 RepID=A0A9W8H9C0_9FUNG|nr:Nuclear envelope morphology protein 1 [Coemansia javaensis]
MAANHGRRRSRFSVVYFCAIYLYTLLFDLLSVPFLEPLLQHLPQPQALVDEPYQPISERAPAPDSDSPHALRAGAHTPVQQVRHRRRRRRASSAASSSTESSHGRPLPLPPAPAPGSAHADESDDVRHVYSPASAASTPSRGAGSMSRGLKKKTLVLDLDETLIHSSPQGSYRAHHRIEVVIDKVACLYYVYKRPHVDYFLRKVSEWYTVVVFTASLAEYADPVIDLLDAQDKYISARLFRESCVPYDSSYAKNLAAVSPDLSQVVLVDNSPLSYFINPTNGIPIQPWVNGDPKDEALLDLLPLLDALRFTDDVRSVLSLRLV